MSVTWTETATHHFPTGISDRSRRSPARGPLGNVTVSR
jgi:hypothetical protein